MHVLLVAALFSFFKTNSVHFAVSLLANGQTCNVSRILINRQKSHIRVLFPRFIIFLVPVARWATTITSTILNYTVSRNHQKKLQFDSMFFKYTLFVSRFSIEPRNIDLIGNIACLLVYRW